MRAEICVETLLKPHSHVSVQKPACSLGCAISSEQWQRVLWEVVLLLTAFALEHAHVASWARLSEASSLGLSFLA